MKSYITFYFVLSKPLIQGASDTRGDSRPKDGGLKASAGMYRTRQLPVGVGLVSENPRLTNMNSWLKPREKRAAKGKLSSFQKIRTRSQTKKAMVSGVRGIKSRIKLGQMVPGVKREPKGSICRSWHGTPETLPPARGGERRGEIGMKRMLRVMPEIDRILVNPKGCPLPVTSRLEEAQVIYPWHYSCISGACPGQGGQSPARLEASRRQRRIYGLTHRVRGLELDAVKVARPVLMNRGDLIPLDSR